MAAAHGNVRGVKLLLRWGADKYARNMDEETPLDVASGRLAAQAVLARRAIPNAFSEHQHAASI